MIIILSCLENAYYIFSIIGVIVAIYVAFYIKETYQNSIKQQIGNDFFNLLSVHNELKRNLKLNIKNTITNISQSDEQRENGNFSYKEKTDYIGLEVFELIKVDFEILFKEFNSILPYTGTDEEIKFTADSKIFGYKIKKDWIGKELLNEISKVNNSENKELEKIQIVFDKIAHEYKEIIYHYCRNWYNIIKFLREKEIESKFNLKTYANILQSQISNNEMVILFYNVLWFSTNSQKKEFHPINLTKHFDLFQNIDLGEEIFRKHQELITPTISNRP